MTSKQSYFLVVVLLSSLVAFGANEPRKENLVFGVISDVHVRDEYPKYLEDAFAFFRDKGVDAVALCGDIANAGRSNELCLTGAAWDAVFPGDKAPDGRSVEKIFIFGNHDSYNKGDAPISKDRAGTWRAAFHEDWAPVYAKTVKGYTFIGAHWGHEKKTAAFVRDTGEKLHLRDNRPFFHVQHPYPANTLYHPTRWGSDVGAAAAAYGSYSNAVVFSGHPHEPLTDERAIWQGSFTAIGAASLYYIAASSVCENGTDRKKGPVQQMPKLDVFNAKPGLVMRVFDDKMVCERWDIARNEKFGPDRVIPLDGSRPYAFEPRIAAVIPPEFPDGAAVSLSTAMGKDRRGNASEQVTLTFPAAKPSATSRVHQYEVQALAKRDGRETAVLTNFFFSEAFFLAPSHEPATGRCVIAVSALPTNEVVRFSISPIECFGKKGKAILSQPWTASPLPLIDLQTGN